MDHVIAHSGISPRHCPPWPPAHTREVQRGRSPCTFLHRTCPMEPVTGAAHVMENYIGHKLAGTSRLLPKLRKQLRHIQAVVLSALTGSFASALAFGLAFGFDRALISSETCLHVFACRIPSRMQPGFWLPVLPARFSPFACATAAPLLALPLAFAWASIDRPSSQ